MEKFYNYVVTTWTDGAMPKSKVFTDERKAKNYYEQKCWEFGSFFLSVYGFSPDNNEHKFFGSDDKKSETWYMKHYGDSPSVPFYTPTDFVAYERVEVA